LERGGKLKDPNYKKFIDIGFEDFKKFASDNKLSSNEKIGFPDSYRNGYDTNILEDIDSKIGKIKANDQILDIGPGCSDLACLYIEKCSSLSGQITLIDSQEMLDLLPDSPGVTKLAGFYPSKAVIDKLNNGPRFDKIICYSVFHYIFIEANVWSFLDLTLDLLKPGGRFLLADIPNFSMRNRFFMSDEGADFHRKFIDSNESSIASQTGISGNQIDDGVLVGMLLRARNRGFHAYIVPQGPLLPMANRREDLLFVKP
jgi:2-polyprenyl-3-methyl-5-hydroxy-6-metoxy-1,4-benzoquinol methylase